MNTRILITIIIFFGFLNQIVADERLSNPSKFINNNIKNILPFKLFTEAAKKVTSVSPKQLLFGMSAAAIVSEGISEKHQKSGNFTNADYGDLTNYVQRVTAKGQINLNNLEIDEAKRRALEDALYFASIKAGANITGFSSIDEQTNLNENFIIEPINKILDYKILKSYEEEGNYIVEIEAVIGDASKINQACIERKKINIKEFRGERLISLNTHSWTNEYIEKILYNIRKELKLNNNIMYTNFSSKSFDFNKDNFDKSFDYKTLVNGSIDVSHGDYIYIPSFIIKKSKIKPKFKLKKFDNKIDNDQTKNYNLLDADSISILSKIEIYDGIKNTSVSSFEKEYLIPINVDSNLEIVELFTKKDQKYFDEKLEYIAIDIYKLIFNELACRPVVANIELRNNKLEVPLGTKQGLRKNQLAVLESNDYRGTFLSVSEVTNNNAVLTPLNSTTKLSELEGQKTRFLE